MRAQGAYAVSKTLPLSKSPKGWLRTDFFHKLQFQSNEVSHKVSLCENFQRRSCSCAMTITVPCLTTIDIGAKRNPPT